MIQVIGILVSTEYIVYVDLFEGSIEDRKFNEAIMI